MVVPFLLLGPARYQLPARLLLPSAGRATQHGQLFVQLVDLIFIAVQQRDGVLALEMPHHRIVCVILARLRRRPCRHLGGQDVLSGLLTLALSMLVVRVGAVLVVGLVPDQVHLGASPLRTTA
jgi:hypothetical protein